MTHKDPHIQQEIEQLTPDLEPLLSAWQPSVPEGYFENLQAAILAKTIEAPVQLESGRNKRIVLWTIMAAAAVVLLFVGIRFFIDTATVTPTFEEQLALLSSDDILDIIHQESELPEVESILGSGLVVEQEVFTQLGVYEELIEETPEKRAESNDRYILSEEEIQSLDDDEWLELMEGEIGL